MDDVVSPTGDLVYVVQIRFYLSNEHEVKRLNQKARHNMTIIFSLARQGHLLLVIMTPLSAHPEAESAIARQYFT